MYDIDLLKPLESRESFLTSTASNKGGSRHERSNNVIHVERKRFQ